MIRQTLSATAIAMLLVACGPAATNNPDAADASPADTEVPNDTRVTPIDVASAEASTDVGPMPEASVDARSDVGPAPEASVDGGRDADPPVEAGPDSATPGGCTRNDQCTASQYCMRSTAACSAEGECAARPEVCPDVINPVCGCNGISYMNSCEAAVAGVSVASTGECGGSCTPMRSCCTADAECGREGMACVGPAAECRGVCKPTPEAGQCWRDSQCPSGVCTGARICECGAACLLPDAPGRCE